MTLQYTVTASLLNLFSDAYSSVRLSIVAAAGTPAAFYVALPDSLANDEHVQAVFTPAKGSLATPVTFDIFFPLFGNVNSIDFRIFPQSTDITNITPETPNFIFTLNTTVKAMGHALLLRFEDKEANTRVLKTINSPGPDLSAPATYTWTGTTVPALTARLANCIAHVTDFNNSKFFEDVAFTNNGQNVDIMQDPSRGGKGHIYFFTNAAGLAVLNIRAGNTPNAARLIYHPFAGEASETSRIVIYNPNQLSRGFEEATPVKNPFTFNNIPGGDQPVFEINNFNNPPNLENGASLYILINDRYDSTIPATSERVNRFTTTQRFINTSNGAFPEKNNIRYIYVTRNGIVHNTRQFAFFCFGNINQVNFDVALAWNTETNSLPTPNPRPALPAEGRVRANYNKVSRVLSWNITHSGLSGAVTVAHFHGPASTNQTANVIIDFNVNNNPIVGSQQLTEDQERQLLSGLWYCNVHTEQNPTGEIRGQMWKNINN